MNIMKTKWYKIIALMVFLPLMGCVDEENSEDISDVEAELILNNQVENIDQLISLDKTVNYMDLLPTYVAIEIEWDDLADNEDGFLIERGASEEGQFTLLTSLEMNETNYIDSMAVNGKTYCYRIGAYNEAGVVYSDITCSNG
tara:strand:+ start:9879 stop:10307 length:429 start_codon:yes stop_codon:yes gene_type:complete